MAQQQNLSAPATAGEVTRIIGPLDDELIIRVVATGATAAEVLEAFTWLNADNLGTELERTKTGRVGQVYEILAQEWPDEDDR